LPLPKTTKGTILPCNGPEAGERRLMAKLISELLQGVTKDLLELLDRKLAALSEHFTPYLKIIWTHFLIIFVAVSTYQEALFNGFLAGVEKVVVTLAQLFIDNTPEAHKATVEMSRDLVQAIKLHYLAYGAIISVSILLTISVTGFPLIYKLLSKRRLMVFISFNRTRENIAETLQQYLEDEGTRTFRIPFQENATHQAIVLRATEGIKTCDSFVCLPGYTQSYVDHEVLAAATSGKPVIFLISEGSGTLPNTADKRYPMFRLETTVRERFKPLIYFLSYVGADLKSTWQLCHRAIFHPLMFVSVRVLLTVGVSGVLVLFSNSFVDVITKGHNLTDRTSSYIQVTTPVELSNLAILLLLLVVAISSLIYSFLLCLGISRQVKARRRARLKTVSAEFSRNDWIGVIPDLFPGGDLYESLFETVPLAHHEIDERVTS
jgi:hypothetical protein